MLKHLLMFCFLPLCHLKSIISPWHPSTVLLANPGKQGSGAQPLENDEWSVRLTSKHGHWLRCVTYKSVHQQPRNICASSSLNIKTLITSYCTMVMGNTVTEACQSFNFNHKSGGSGMVIQAALRDEDKAEVRCVGTRLGGGGEEGMEN